MNINDYKNGFDSELVRNPIGFLQLKNIPSLSDIQNYYSEKYYQEETGSYQKSYSEDELKFIEEKIKQRDYLVDKNIKSKSKKMLDVGCGEGFDLHYYKNKGWDVTGLDYSSYGVECNNPDLLGDVQVGNVYSILDDITKNDEKYDLIILKHVLEHVLDPVELLSKLKKILEIGGVLLISVPNDDTYYHHFLKENNNIDNNYWIADPDHISYFNKKSLTLLAEHTNWVVLDVISDFPINLFLINDLSNYVRDKNKGKDAHMARIDMELIIAENSMEDINNYFRSQADLGLGRSLFAILSI